MAESALFSLTQTVLNQLSSKLLQEAAFLWGIEDAGVDEIDKLTLTISAVQRLLLDAEDKSHHNHNLRLWLKDLRRALYDADDLLDDFSTEALQHHRRTEEVRSSFSSSDQLGYGLKFSSEIQAIRVRIDEIAKWGEMFGLNSIVRKKHRGKMTNSDVPELVVGREDDKKRILELLLQKPDDLTVVSIVGIGGIGKTTLAQLLFNDQMVRSHFQLRVWVCVTDKFDVNLIVEKIVESCTNEKLLAKDLEMDGLMEVLSKHVSSKRCLIVLDGVWDEDREEWDHLMSLLNCGAEGSRVLVTTRIMKVVRVAATRAEPYELKGLNKSESWSLFRGMAFKGGEVAGNENREAIGRDILVKCKGVPLAIKTIARELFFKESESEWVAFKSRDIWEMDHQGENDIMSTLRLSYDHLPGDLKRCFAYCSLFPKDYEFNVKKLVQLWVAQGFVTTSDSLRNRFDVGVEYFEDLLSRLFFKKAVKDEWGYIKSCKMHALMHDLAVLVAGEEEETLNLDISNSPNSKHNNHDPVRHLSLNLEGGIDTEVLVSHWTSTVHYAEKLRTLFCTNQDYLQALEICNEITFSRTTSLRALDLSHFKMSLVSHTIHKLKHLRYLDLTRNHMEILPEEITELVNLEVLELEKCLFLKQLPRNTGKLLSLTYLGLKGCSDLKCMPLGIGKLCWLRELPIFLIPEGDTELTAAGISELHYLNNLRGSLKMKNLEWVKNPSEEGKAANMRGKQHLKTLELSWGFKTSNDDYNADVEGELLEALSPHPNLEVLRLFHNGGSKCPTWFPSMTGLVMIQIANSENWKRLSSLDQLPFLEKLELKNLNSLEWIECGVKLTSFFPSLKSLKLDRCPKLKGWSLPAGVPLPEFASATDLDISECDSITSIPHFSPALRVVSLYGVGKHLLKLIIGRPPSASHVEKLYINHMDDLDTLPEEMFSSFSSLELLSVMYCSKLRTLSPYQVASLQSIEIECCDELDLSDRKEEEDLHDVLPSLTEVSFVGVPKLTSFPEWLRFAPSLRVIVAADCPITCVPEWLTTMKQLQDLTICDCGKSAAEFVAEDLWKVSHVSRVLVNDVMIMSNGRFNEDWADNGEE
ncbi:Disease resistance protein RGA2 [Linum perenne]